jgi:tRNA(Arg) A34 adenosine deaminase TadA
MRWTSEDEKFMRLAVVASAQALAEGNGPFGATLVKDGRVELVSRNNQVSAADPLGHAEVVLVREALARNGPEVLRGATVYASGEPCAMCSGAMFWAGVARVVYAATQADIIDALGGAELPIGSADVLAGAKPAVRVEGPLLAEEAIAVLRRFGHPPH